MTTSTNYNRVLLRLSRRAESVDREQLVQTFVDAGPLATLLASRDHQIVFGRRGTGKTHALLYLASDAVKKGDLAVYVDLRRVGSTGGLYADPAISLSERATRLLSDVLCAIHDEVLAAFYDREDVDLGPIGAALDAFVTAATQVVVAGPVTSETEIESTLTSATKAAIGLGLAKAPSLKLEFSDEEGSSSKERERHSSVGDRRHRVHFGAVGTALSKITSNMRGHRIWLLLDEWSVVPADLQPYLADLVRRAILPIPGVSVKIAAIEHRAVFQIPGEKGDYIGIETGADASADLNLDDFMVFDNDAENSTAFFLSLLYRHFRTAALEAKVAPVPSSPKEFLRDVFTQKTPFEELVAAAEGVPRDAINIVALAAQRAADRQIAIADIRNAAKTWYQRDKEAAVAANPELKNLLYWIVDKVIGHRRARAFLLRSGTRHDLVDALFDARVLHVVKRSIAAHDQPGVRFDAYKIDYGCYVDLLSTQKAPQGLLPLDEAKDDVGHIDVPPDDYRAIRRAILDLEEFDRSKAG